MDEETIHDEDYQREYLTALNKGYVGLENPQVTHQTVTFTKEDLYGDQDNWAGDAFNAWA